MTTPAEQAGTPIPPDCPPDCAECAADDGGWAELEAEAEQLLARHDAGCVAEAIQDAYATGHDEPESVRFVAAQMFEDGHSPCRCGQATQPVAG